MTHPTFCDASFCDASPRHLARAPQAFFWSVPGSKLFGNHPDLHEPSKLSALLADAFRVQPSIVYAFLDESTARGLAKNVLAARVAASLAALLELTWREKLGSLSPSDRRKGVETVLLACARDPECYAACLEKWTARAQTAAELLDDFAQGAVLPWLQAKSSGGGNNGGPGGGGGSSASSASSASSNLADDAAAEVWIQMLSRLFIARPAQWTAFRHVVPAVFDSVLRLGSAPRSACLLVSISAAPPPLSGHLRCLLPFS